VGTAKRERKKANRQIRLEELEKLRRKQKVRRRGVQLGIIIPLAVLALIGLILLLGSGDDDKGASDTTVAATSVDPALDPAVTDGPDTTEAPTTTIAPLPCPAEDGSSAATQKFPAAPASCIDATKVYVAEFTTNKGSFTAELDPGIAPGTVNNFVYLARYHYFDGTKCHRIIPGFVVQCGDPTGKGSGNPGYSFPDELPAAGAYQIGSLAMANRGPDTNGSQFFIISGGDGVKLAPNYSLFGKVTVGFDDTVKAMEKAGTDSGSPSEDVVIEKVVISVKAGATASTTTLAATTTSASPTTSA